MLSARSLLGAAEIGVPIESPGATRALRSDRREAALLAGTTALVAGLVLLVGPAPGDAPAHLYRTFLVQHGILVWDNLWYAGTYPLASYSLLYYVPAALLGNLTVVLAAAVLSSVLFASLVRHQWGSSGRFATRVFAILAAAPAFTGLYSYTLGFAAMLGALRALQARRAWLWPLLAALTLGFSPLAFAFLCLVVVSAVLVSRLSRRNVAILCTLLILAGLELAVLHVFPTGGVYTFHLVNLVGVLGVAVAGALVAARAPRGRAIAAFFVLWGAGSVVLYIVPTPLGDNWTRLGAFSFPIMLLAADLARYRPRPLVLTALAGSLAYTLVPFLLLIPYRLDNRPASAAFWQPALQFLDRHASPDYRVEVVPTAAHWEAYWLPRAGFAIARGWYRQLDVVENPLLYRSGLDAAEYRHWLRQRAVEYVVVPHTTLDPIGGPQEATVVEAPDSGLQVVLRSASLTIYRLPHPTPLLTGAGHAGLTLLDHATIGGVVGEPGRYLLRVHYTPYWRPTGVACVAKARNDLTRLTFSRAGSFSLTVPQSVGELAEAVEDGPPAGCHA